MKFYLTLILMFVSAFSTSMLSAQEIEGEGQAALEEPQLPRRVIERVEPVSTLKSRGIEFLKTEIVAPPIKFIPIKLKTFEEMWVDSMIKENTRCCENGICRVAGKEWSCNLTDNTLIEQQAGNETFELLSHIAISTEVKKQSDNPLQGTKKFCNACFEKIYAQDGEGTVSFEDEKLKMQQNLEELAVERVLKDHFFQHYEQLKYFKAHQSSINKDLRKVYPDKSEKELNEIRDNLLCMGTKPFQSFKQPESCSGSEVMKRVKGAFAKMYMNVDLDENLNPFSEDGMKAINKPLINFSKAIEKPMKNGKAAAKDIEKFDEMMTNLVINNHDRLKQLCENNFQAGQSAQLARSSFKMRDFYKIFVTDKITSISPQDLTIRVDAFNQIIIGANILEPDLALVTRNPESLCKLIASGMNEQKMKEKGILSLLKDINDIEGEGIHLERLAKMAQSSCLNLHTVNQRLHVMCGDFSNSNIPVVMNFDKMTKAEKIALGSLRCENDINVVDEGRYCEDPNDPTDVDRSPEKIFEIVAKQGWRKFRKQFRNLLEEANESAKNNNFPTYLLVASGMNDGKVELDKNGDPISNGDNQGPSGMAGASAAMQGNSKSGMNFFQRLFTGDEGESVISYDMQNNSGFLGIGGSSKNSESVEYKSTSEQTGARDLANSQEQGQLSDKKTNDIFQGFKDEFVSNQQANPLPQNYSQQDLMNPVNEGEVLSKIPASKYKELSENMAGDKSAERQKALLDYLSPNSQNDLSFQPNTANESELRAEIDSLKKEIAEERYARYQAENKALENKIDELNGKISDMENYIKTQNKSYSPSLAGGEPSRSPASAGSGEEVKQLGEAPRVNQPASDFNDSGQILNNVNKPAYNGNNMDRNLISGDRFLSILQSENGGLEFKNNQLVLKSKNQDETYTVEINDVVIEAGKIKKIIYKDKEILVSSLDVKSQKAVEDFVAKNGSKIISKEIEDVIKLSIAANPEVEQPGAEVARYIQMLCGWDPGHPKCLQK